MHIPASHTECAFPPVPRGSLSRRSVPQLTESQLQCRYNIPACSIRDTTTTTLATQNSTAVQTKYRSTGSSNFGKSSYWPQIILRRPSCTSRNFPTSSLSTYTARKSDSSHPHHLFHYWMTPTTRRSQHRPPCLYSTGRWVCGASLSACTAPHLP